MICEKCGAIINDNAVQCFICGAYVENTNNNSTINNNGNTDIDKPVIEKKRLNGTAIAILIVLINLVLISTLLIIKIISSKDLSNEPIKENSVNITNESITENSANITNEHITENSVNTNEYVTNNSFNSANEISIEEREALNTFLSNFAEVEFPNYDSDYYDESQLINFSILHNYVNNNGNIKLSKNGQVTLYANVVQKNTMRFFNKSVSLSSTDIATYNSNDNTFVSDSDVLNSNNHYSSISYHKFYAFAVVDKLYDNGNGTYDVEFTIYNSKSKLNRSFYTYSPADAANNPNLYPIFYGEATICDYYADSANKYQLLSYETHKF